MMIRQGLVEFIQCEVLAACNRAASALNGAQFRGRWSIAGSRSVDGEIEP
jgi:hypothetical protein